ncbi:MAG: polysaccharide biosynthesis tyrosine autokinase [Anaerolineae bacterium]|nr:polysaccharide biosynthesis tyrosine autokinase [Anaerolineae bacterium]
MEEQLDIRRYLTMIGRWWWLIAGCAALAAVSAFVISSIIPPTYEASAVVIITEPQYQMQFDPRFTVEEWAPAYKAFPTLAESDGVLGRVVETYTPSPAARIEDWSIEELAEMVESSSEGDPSLVVLKVSSRSPEDAAGIASAWAQALVDQGNRIYAVSEDDVAFFEAQAAQAKAALDDADADLVAFQGQNQANILQAELSSLLRFQTDYLADQRAITYLLQDIEALRGQLARQPADRPSSLSDDLTMLFLQIKAFNASASAPIQLQVNSTESLSSRSLSEQIAFLDDLADVLETKAKEIASQAAALEPEILALQRQLQEIQLEQSRLERARSLAYETYMALARKLEEARITAQGNDGMLQVGSRAAVPVEPASPHRAVNTALACMVGGLLGVGAALLFEYLDDKVRTPEDVDRHLGIKTLGAIGRLAGDEALVTLAEPLSPASEAFRTLSTNVRCAGVGDSVRTLLVTGVGSADGKTTTAANLAVALAQAGLVVTVVDADLRRPRQHRLFGLDAQGGLARSLAEGGMDGRLQPSQVERLSILPAGERASNPPQLLNSQHLRDILDDLARKADVVIVDSPPVLAVTDAAILAQAVDGVLLVIDAGETAQDAARQAAESLQQVGAHLVGAVLNKVPTRRGGYYDRQGYYGDGDEKQNRRAQVAPAPERQ